MSSTRLQDVHAPSVVKKELVRGMPSLLEFAVALFVIGRCIWIFSALLRSPQPRLDLAQDDFYYYLKSAQHLAYLGKSTFFQNTPTNGYHPLYFLVLAGVSLFVHSLHGIHRFLFGLDVVSATLIFLLSRRLMAKITSPVLSVAVAVLITSVSISQICDQMEITLTLPLGFAFLLAGFIPDREITARWAARLGALAALLVLSRLDASLLVLLYVVGFLCTRDYRTALSPKLCLSFLIPCVLPLAVYLWVNIHSFHTLLPISGMAKELRYGWRPSTLFLRSFNGINEGLLLLSAGVTVLAWGLRRRLSPSERVLLFSVLGLPFCFYGLQMLISDWPAWDWYFYALRFAAAGCGLVTIASVRYLFQGARRQNVELALGTLFLVGSCLKLGRANYKVDVVMTEIQHAANVLADFAQEHPGTYAMGDRSGMFAVSTSSPVLQAEGLMMDRSYLQHIQNEDDLRSTLSSYGVQYYVAFVFDRNKKGQMRDGCFHAMEPSIAGPSALRMRSTFCETPLLHFPGTDGEYMVYRV